jgi:hypothetical protein
MRITVQQQSSQVEDVAMARVNRLDTTDSNMARFIETYSHPWMIWVLVFQDL